MYKTLAIGLVLLASTLALRQYPYDTAPKAYAQLYIDDAALCCPLIYDKTYSDRPFVDWKKVREMLVERGVL